MKYFVFEKHFTNHSQTPHTGSVRPKQQASGQSSCDAQGQPGNEDEDDAKNDDNIDRNYDQQWLTMQHQLTNFEVDSIVETDPSLCIVFQPDSKC